MPARTTAYVTPEMLQWAREQAACSLEDAGKIVKQPLQMVESWESPGSDARPTVRQAQKLANAYGIPFALLYLGQPYTDLEPDPVPEFRGLDPGSGQVRPHTRQLRRMVRQAQERQAFAVELLELAGQAPLPWVGSVTPSQNSELLGADIRASLANGAEPSHPGERERVLDWWVERVEDLGAIVSRYRPDGNLHWTVEPSEARGLSLCHPLAPYIVLNSKDSPAGRLFTLMHELAHLYFGQCGVDDIGDERLLPVEARLLEQRCNQVAAAILMPGGLFTSEWTSAKGDVEDKVRAIADRFGVSRQAAGVRAKSDGIGFISSDQYSAMFGYLTNEYNEFRDSRARSSGGGGMSVPVRVLKDYGSRYVQLVCDAHAEEQLSLLDTADALSVRIGDVSGIKRRLR